MSNHDKLPMGNDWGALAPPAIGQWRPSRSVSVIIPARNCPDTLTLTLAALAHQSYPAHLLEIVVVDDGSEPAIQVPELAPEHTRVVRAPDHSTSWGRGNALAVGASVSDGEILHWLDADLIPFPEHVAAQLRWHHVAPDAVTLGYKRFVTAEWPTAAEVARRAGDGSLAELFPVDQTEPHDYIEELIEATDQLRTADHLAFRAHVGATAALPRTLYREAGGIDVGLRLGEDSEFGYRLAQVGALFIPEPQARSWHLGPSHAMQLGGQLRRYNRPYLADRMPLPRWLRGDGRHSWSVPLVTAEVVVDGEPLELVRDCVERLLGGDEHDLRVRLVGRWHELAEHRRSVLEDPSLDLRLLAAWYRSEPRVELAETAGASPFPSPYLLRVPARAGVAPTTVRRLLVEADRWRVGRLQLLPEGGGAVPAPLPVELWRTAALHRAAHWCPEAPVGEAIAAVWGGRWVSDREYGVSDLAALPTEGWGGGGRAAFLVAGHPIRCPAGGGPARPTAPAGGIVTSRPHTAYWSFTRLSGRMTLVTVVIAGDGAVNARRCGGHRRAQGSKQGLPGWNGRGRQP